MLAACKRSNKTIFRDLTNARAVETSVITACVSPSVRKTATAIIPQPVSGAMALAKVALETVRVWGISVATTANKDFC